MQRKNKKLYAVISIVSVLIALSAAAELILLIKYSETKQLNGYSRSVTIYNYFLMGGYFIAALLMAQGFFVLTKVMKSYDGILVKEKNLLLCVFLTFVLTYATRLGVTLGQTIQI